MDTLFDAMLVHKLAYLKMHVPDWLLKLVLGEMSIEVTKSTNVSCKKLLDHGFEFKYPTIDECMKDLIGVEK
jgi:NAD dependent epimerase/dehydratase family enzyme